MLRELLDAHRAQLAALLTQPRASWDSLVVPLEEMHHRLARTWSPSATEWRRQQRRAAHGVQRLFAAAQAWHTELAQNERLYRAYETILANEGDRLTAGQRKLLQNALRDFDSPASRCWRTRRQSSKRWSNSWRRCNPSRRERARRDQRVVAPPDPGKRARRPAAADLERARAAAQPHQLEGWYFTLDAPNYQAVMMHAENEALRRDFYQAWVTRASTKAPPTAVGTTRS